MAEDTLENGKSTAKQYNFIRIAIGALMGILSGGMLVLAFPLFKIWPLVFIAFVPMLVAAHRIVPRKWAGLPMALGNFI
jgi:apolipoprotein N-acyltransferase